MDTGSGNKKVDFLAFFGKFGDFGIFGQNKWSHGIYFARQKDKMSLNWFNVKTDKKHNKGFYQQS